ncbi:MAG: EAL domain-containing protein, partial [Sphingomonadaceae bacterium]
VQGIGSDRRRELITRTIIGLARGMNLCCVAEGVETRQQLDFLEGHGCSHVQGYLTGRPMTEEELRQLVLRSGAAQAAASGKAVRRTYRLGSRGG